MAKSRKFIDIHRNNHDIINKLKDNQGDPIFDKDEDIYNHAKKAETAHAKKVDLEDELDEGLDVPGADLDDEQELVGEEDEENNYYSLGGDNHDDDEEKDEEDDE